MTRFSVELDGSDLVPQICQDLRAPGVSPVDAVERALEAHLFERFEERLRDRLVKPPVIRLHSMYFRNRFATLPALIDNGYDTWYTEVRFPTRPADVVEELDLTATGINVMSISYGFGVERRVQMKVRQLKRQTNHHYRINHLALPGTFFRAVLERLRVEGEPKQPLIANFQPGFHHPGYRTVAFDHMLTGARVFCSCARVAHARMLKDAMERRPSFIAGSWPHEVIELLEGAAYQNGVCHLCLARTGEPGEGQLRYGASIETGFESFVDQVRLEMGVDERTARAELQQILGLSRWVREAALYATIRDLFPDHRVLREASPEWLGRMRLDIYLPELNLAIEHQGEQHYRPLAVFGGDDAHSRILERDALKRRLCEEHGVTLVEVRYDASISKHSMRQRLQRFLQGRVYTKDV